MVDFAQHRDSVNEIWSLTSLVAFKYAARGAKRHASLIIYG